MSSLVAGKMRSARFHLTVLIGIVLIGLAPMIPVGIASSIATWNGCTLSESSPSPCLVNEFDWGPTLYQMGVLGWFGLVSLPLAAFLFVIWIVWFITSALLTWHRKRINSRMSSEP